MATNEDDPRAIAASLRQVLERRGLQAVLAEEDYGARAIDGEAELDGLVSLLAGSVVDPALALSDATRLLRRAPRSDVAVAWEAFPVATDQRDNASFAVDLAADDALDERRADLLRLRSLLADLGGPSDAD